MQDQLAHLTAEQQSLVQAAVHCGLSTARAVALAPPLVHSACSVATAWRGTEHASCAGSWNGERISWYVPSCKPTVWLILSYVKA